MVGADGECRSNLKHEASNNAVESPRSRKHRKARKAEEEDDREDRARELVQRDAEDKRRADRKEARNKKLGKKTVAPAPEVAPKWVFGETEYNGKMQCSSTPKKQQVEGPVADGIATLRNDPDTYEAVYFQDDMPEWPKDQQSYTLIFREAGSDIQILSQSSGGFNWVQACDQVRVMSGRVVGEYVGASADASRGLQRVGSISGGRGISCFLL